MTEKKQKTIVIYKLTNLYLNHLKRQR